MHSPIFELSDATNSTVGSDQMLTSGRTGRQSGILHRKDAAGHRVWTHLSWVRLMEPSLITQKTSSPPHPVTRLQSVAPGKVCRGNPEFSGSLPEDESPQQCAAGRHNWRIREHRSKKLGAKAQLWAATTCISRFCFTASPSIPSSGGTVTGSATVFPRSSAPPFPSKNNSRGVLRVFVTSW